MILSCRFDVPTAEDAAFRAQLRTAVGLLSAQAGCELALAGTSVDGPGPTGQVWTLLARFTSVTAYRRALSPFDVRTHVVPLLARARDDGASTVQILLEADDGTVVEHRSLLASDPGNQGARDR